ncbi:MAG: hypothetical protein H6519_09795 [Microthrixaceae bacterium]|nr:hypothetical protein [Acidimicrobiales bacterium]MCB9404708.1 hypothetical protein [Microthrixaceae bacterium]
MVPAPREVLPLSETSSGTPRGVEALGVGRAGTESGPSAFLLRDAL